MGRIINWPAIERKAGAAQYLSVWNLLGSELTEERTMKSLITSGILAVSLTLSASAAMAAPTQANPMPNAAQSYRTVKAIPFAPGYGVPRVPPGVYLPNIQRGVDVGQFISGMLGSSLPPQYAQIVRNAVRVSASHRSSGSYESPGSYDFSTPSPTIDVDNSQSQAAIDASDQAIQQEDQSLQDLDASVAAAEQQNDAAKAAAVQTDINAGM
jgi:hypothetical protein